MKNDDLIRRSELWKAFDTANLFDDGNPRHIAQQIVEDAPAVEAAVFPCKIGDTVWFVGTSTANRLNLGVIETTVEKLILKKGGIYMKLACNAMYETSCKSIGKTVFFTQEEAETVLAGKQGER